MNTSIKSGDEALGRIIAKRRKASGWSREDLAQFAGISYVYVAQIETGYRMPGLGTMVTLAKVLRLSLDDLFL